MMLYLTAITRFSTIPRLAMALGFGPLPCSWDSSSHHTLSANIFKTYFQALSWFRTRDLKLETFWARKKVSDVGSRNGESLLEDLSAVSAAKVLQKRNTHGQTRRTSMTRLLLLQTYLLYMTTTVMSTMSSKLVKRAVNRDPQQLACSPANCYQYRPLVHV